MLQNLRFLDTGEIFPPFDERDRMNRYRQSKLLYEGQHKYVFHRWTRTEGVEDLNVIVNWHRRLSTLWADMLFGQEPEIKAENQEAVDAVIKANDFNERLYESAIDVSRFGTGVFKVRLKDGAARIEIAPTDIWFPVVDPANIKDVQHHVLAWRYKVKEGETENWFLSVEIHHKGRVEYRTYSLNKDQGISTLLEQSEENTGIDDFLVRPVHNITTSDKVEGSDDYNDINSLLEEIELRLTQISRVLDKHADPSMYGDENALEYDERTGEFVVRGGGKFFPVSDDTVKPGYLTWNGDLEAAQAQIKTLMQQFYIITNTSPAAFGQLEQGLAESGSALRRLMMATIVKVNRMKVRYTNAIEDVLELAGELQARNGGLNVGKVSVEFRSALPEDENEKVQNETTRYGAGLTSLESSLRRLDGSSGEQLQEEINSIVRETEDDGRNEDL